METNWRGCLAHEHSQNADGHSAGPCIIFAPRSVGSLDSRNPGIRGSIQTATEAWRKANNGQPVDADTNCDFPIDFAMAQV
jgi:hypothetical protein